MRRVERFNENQKSYLQAKFHGHATRRKLDPEVVTTEMQCPRTHATDGEMLFLVEEFLSPYQKISDRRTSEPLFSQRLSTIVLANLPLSLTDTTSVLWFRAKQ